MLNIEVYNVANTSEDKPLYCNDWVEAVEKVTGYRITRSDSIVGAHVSSMPYCSGVQQTEYIAITTKENNSQPNSQPYYVDQRVICQYSRAKNVK